MIFLINKRKQFMSEFLHIGRCLNQNIRSSLTLPLRTLTQQLLHKIKHQITSTDNNRMTTFLEQSFIPGLTLLVIILATLKQIDKDRNHQTIYQYHPDNRNQSTDPTPRMRS